MAIVGRCVYFKRHAVGPRSVQPPSYRVPDSYEVRGVVRWTTAAPLGNQSGEQHLVVDESTAFRATPFDEDVGRVPFENVPGQVFAPACGLLTANPFDNRWMEN